MGFFGGIGGRLDNLTAAISQELRHRQALSQQSTADRNKGWYSDPSSPNGFGFSKAHRARLFAEEGRVDPLAEFEITYNEGMPNDKLL